MLSVHTNAIDLVKQFRTFEKELGKRVVRKSPRDACYKGRDFMRAIAPMKTGRLKAGIQVKKRGKKGYTLSSFAMGNQGFPYNLWINEVPGYEAIRITKRFRSHRIRKLHGNTKIMYRSYETKTGHPRYFWSGIEFVQKYFPQKAFIELNKALEVSFR